MKPKMGTGEWLVEARRQADLSQAELAELAGLKSVLTISNFEKGVRVPSPLTQARLERALKPLVPLMFIDEEKILNDAKAYMQWEEEGSLCRLAYSLGRHGFVFTGVSSVRKDPPAAPYITVSLGEAVRLLEEQSAGNALLAAPKSAYDGEGAKLAKARKALGLSQSTVAAMLSSNRIAISRFECGRLDDADLAARYRELLENAGLGKKASDGEGAKLAKARKELGLGQPEVAAMLSVEQADVSLLEHGMLDDAGLAARYRELLESAEPRERAADGEGARLAKARKALGLSQMEVASMLSADQPIISRLERGLAKPHDLMKRYQELIERLTSES